MPIHVSTSSPTGAVQTIATAATTSHSSACTTRPPFSGFTSASSLARTIEHTAHGANSAHQWPGHNCSIGVFASLPRTRPIATASTPTLKPAITRTRFSCAVGS